jgi:hypothetical protein
VFSQVYRQETTEAGVWAFREALADLSAAELDLACREAIKRLKFFPTPAEIRECLTTARENLRPIPQSVLPPWEEETPEDVAAREEALEKLRELASKKIPGRTGPGPDYTLCPKHSSEKSALLAEGQQIFAKHNPEVIAATENVVAKFMERFSPGQKAITKQAEESRTVAPVSSGPYLANESNDSASTVQTTV